MVDAPYNPYKVKNVDLIAFYQCYCGAYLRARLGDNETGASLVEYALLLALIAVVCIGAVSFLSGGVQTKYSTVGSSLT